MKDKVKLFMLKTNNTFNASRRIIFLLALFFNFSFAAFQEVNDLKSSSISYDFEKGNYKIYLKDSLQVSYKDSRGFKFFLPDFTRDFRVEMLRVGSIGKIDGYLSLKKNFSKKNILNITQNDLDYFITDYKYKSRRQLAHLLDEKVIPYKNRTSLVLEGYDFPTSFSNRLNKWLYFKYEHSGSNKLNQIVYTYYILLDKYLVDNYVKKSFKVLDYKEKEFKYLHTYLQKLGLKSDIKKVKKKNINKSKTKKIVKPALYLDIKKIVFMKEFGLDDSDFISFENQIEKLSKKNDKLKEYLEKYQKVFNDNEITNSKLNRSDINFNINYLDNLKLLDYEIENLERLTNRFKEIDSYINYASSFDLYKRYTEDLEYHYENLKRLADDLEALSRRNYSESNNLNNKTERIDINFEEAFDDIEFKKSIRCMSNFKKFDKTCLSISNYFSNYVNQSLKHKKIPSKDILFKYASPKLLNDVAVYYYHNLLDTKNAELYLNEALKKVKDKDEQKIIEFNKATLLCFYNSKNSNKKANEYLKKLDFKEAYYNLAINYHLGFGIKEDSKLAFKYFKKAYESGLIYAKNNYEKLKKLGYK